MLPAVYSLSLKELRNTDIYNVPVGPAVFVCVCVYVCQFNRCHNQRVITAEYIYVRMCVLRALDRISVLIPRIPRHANAQTDRERDIVSPKCPPFLRGNTASGYHLPHHHADHRCSSSADQMQTAHSLYSF